MFSNHLNSTTIPSEALIIHIYFIRYHIIGSTVLILSVLDSSPSPFRIHPLTAVSIQLTRLINYAIVFVTNCLPPSPSWAQSFAVMQSPASVLRWR